MELFNKLIVFLTGGRPMKYIGGGFTDCVSGERVNYYECNKGVRYMANNKWGFFRVKTSKQTFNGRTEK